MSAFGGKADATRTLRNVCYDLKQTIRSLGLLPRKMTVGPYSGDHKSADRILIGVVRASKVGNATEECAREAAKLPNCSPFRQDFLQLVKHWLELAGSIEFGEQLDGFTQNSAEPNHPNL